MAQIKVMIQSPDAEEVSADLVKKISPMADVQSRRLPTRSPELIALLEIAVGTAAVTLEICRWVKEVREKGKCRGKVTVGGKTFDFEEVNEEALLKIMKHAR
jgi:hypothetical protein